MSDGNEDAAVDNTDDDTNDNTTAAESGTAQTAVSAAVDASAAASATAKDDDERLAYRGVFQRLFIRPEIGAAMAAIAIWVFFWSTSVPFGLANGAASLLDVTASPLGIMAVAVAMLMIGGEFDLSSGAATGALGIVTVLIVRDITGEMGGAGLSLWLAIPISLLVALGLGWFNGTMVNRTGLPSFIVTLGSFFIIKGAKLGFSKKLTDQIEVGKLDDLAIAASDRGSDKGYDFFNTLFAAEWKRKGDPVNGEWPNAKIWEGRDSVYTIAVLLGLSLLVIALYELHYRRKDKMNPTGGITFVVGIAIAIGGILYLHNSDGVAANGVGAIIIGVGMLVGFVGLGLWRYEPLKDRGGVTFSAGTLQALGAGAGAYVLSIILALSLDSQNSDDITFMITEQGLRAILFIGFAGLAAVAMLVAVNRARHSSLLSGSVVLAITAVAVAAMAFFIRSESGTQKFRGQVFAIMLAIAALMLIWAVCSVMFEQRRSMDPAADRLGQMLTIGGAIAIVVGVVCRLLWMTQAELDRDVPPSIFSVRILWFFGFTALCAWVLGRTKFGSWTFAVGGNKEASRQIGVPAARTKTQLFMLVSTAAWLVGLLLAFRLNTIQANTGDGEEFEYIIAAVVGGTLLTGGYGSVIGAGIGAFIMAMAVQGIPSSRWNSDWRFVFLGAILLLAVIANNFIRAKAEAIR